MRPDRDHLDATRTLRASRMAAEDDIVARHGGSAAFEDFVDRAFTERERTDPHGRPRRRAGLVARLLAKELVLELLELADRPSVLRSPESAGNAADLAGVEILSEDSGRPTVGGDLVPPELQDRFHVSLSHDGRMAGALVLLEIGPSPSLSEPGAP